MAGAENALTVTAADTYDNAVPTYTGSHSLVYSGASAGRLRQHRDLLHRRPQHHFLGSPGEPLRHRRDGRQSSGTSVPVGTATPLNFTSGVATVTGSSNGVFKAARSGATTLAATDGKLSTASPLALTVSVGSASNYAWTSPTISTGTLGLPPPLHPFIAKVPVTDSLGERRLQPRHRQLGDRHRHRRLAIDRHHRPSRINRLLDLQIPDQRQLHQHDHRRQILGHRLHERHRDGEPLRRGSIDPYFSL